MYMCCTYKLISKSVAIKEVGCNSFLRFEFSPKFSPTFGGLTLRLTFYLHNFCLLSLVVKNPTGRGGTEGQASDERQQRTLLWRARPRVATVTARPRYTDSVYEGLSAICIALGSPMISTTRSRSFLSSTLSVALRASRPPPTSLRFCLVSCEKDSHIFP